MSIIAYYIHVDDTQLQALRDKPALVWNIKSDPRFATAALFDLDKDYEVLAWLISEKKRKERIQELATYRAIDRKHEVGSAFDKAKFQSALNEEIVKLGGSTEDTNAIPTDSPLEAIEGRGSEAQRDPRLNFGLGSARWFRPEEVRKLSAALQSVKEESIRAKFNRATMAKYDVGGMGWLEEEDTVLDEFLLPGFRRLQAFYADAARRGHHVLVIYQ